MVNITEFIHVQGFRRAVWGEKINHCGNLKNLLGIGKLANGKFSGRHKVLNFGIFLDVLRMSTKNLGQYSRFSGGLYLAMIPLKPHLLELLPPPPSSTGDKETYQLPWSAGSPFFPSELKYRYLRMILSNGWVF